MDQTPFKTRSKLLSVYRDHVLSIRSGGNPFPVQLEVNINDSCSQNCGWCISENVRNNPTRLDLSNASLKQFFNDFKRLGGQSLVWSGGGEPTSHPDFSDALALVGETGLAQGLMTHGAFNKKLIDPIARHCEWVRMSVDTSVGEEYARRRGASVREFEMVFRNARALVEKGIKVGFCINVADWNRSRIKPLFKLAENTGVDYLQVRPVLPTPFLHKSTDKSELLNMDSIPDLLIELSKMQTIRNHEGPQLIISQDKFADLQAIQRAGGDFGYQGCASHNLFVVLNCDGNLSVCMYHLFDQRYVFGNVYQNSLEEIWTSEQRRMVVAHCKGGQRGLNHTLHSCQVCCKGHEINKVLLALELDNEIEKPISGFL